MKSAIYAGRVRHRRSRPAVHEFGYRVSMLYFDLDELDRVFRGRWLWSTRWPAPAWFRRADYLGPRSVPLKRAVGDLVHERTGRRPSGPIGMLTQVRNFWYIQNPVTFYYCFDASDHKVETVVAEVTNTPWSERYAYVLSAGSDDFDGVRSRFRKAFHISPFIDMDAGYDWCFPRPDQQLSVHMNVARPDGKIFDATLTLSRREISGRTLAGRLLMHPFMTWKIVAGIYWHALRLRLKGCPFYTHPAKRSVSESSTNHG